MIDMKWVNRLHRVVAMLSFMFLLSTIGVAIKSFYQGAFVQNMSNFFFLHETLLAYNVRGFLLLACIDAVTGGFFVEYGAKFRRSFFHTFKWSTIISVLVVFFYLFLHIPTQVSYFFIAFIVFTHVFGIIDLSKYYLYGEYEFRNPFDRNRRL